MNIVPLKGDDPQRVFESLNSKQEKLLETDKIRNFVLMGAKPQKQEQLYKKYWIPIEKRVLQKDRDTFFRYYLVVNAGSLPNEDKVYVDFKQYCINSDAKIESILNSLLQYAGYFKLIQDCLSTDTGYKKRIYNLNRLKLNTVIPLLFNLLVAFEKNELNEKQLEKCLGLVESFLVRRYFCGYRTNSSNKHFADFDRSVRAIMLETGKDYCASFVHRMLTAQGLVAFPKDLELEDNISTFNLYNQKNALKLVLERIENSSNNEPIPVAEMIDKRLYTVEHIMPQTLNDLWKEALGDSWEIIHTKYKHAIGNLSLTASNTELGNRPFLEKRDMPKKGYADSKLFLNEYVKTLDVWNLEKIEERTQILLNVIKDIWPYPEKEIMATFDDDAAKVSNVRVIPPLEDYEQIGDFIREAMRRLEESEFVFTESEIQEMQTSQFTKNKFKPEKSSHLPFIEFDKNKIRDKSGYGRYWSDEFIFGKYHFYVMSQWGKAQIIELKENFTKWYMTLGEIKSN